VNRIDKRLFNHYEHWHKQLIPFNIASGDFTVGIDDALRAHYLLCDFFLYEGEKIASPGPRDKTLFLSALDRQTAGFSGKQKWDDLFHIAATLFFGIVKNHPFYDGNKRTALLLMLYQLWNFGRIADRPQKEFETLAVRTAANQLSLYSSFSDFKKKGDAEIRTIAHFLRKSTRHEDKRYYRVTFRDFATALRKFGIDIEGPSDNKINIIKTIPIKKGLFRQRTEFKRQTIYQVGCPRMTMQINPKAQKEILKACGLTSENGYDSQVLFADSDPLGLLIGEFQHPLRRLKDK
jgi:death-on-curing protein